MRIGSGGWLGAAARYCSGVVRPRSADVIIQYVWLLHEVQGDHSVRSLQATMVARVGWIGVERSRPEQVPWTTDVQARQIMCDVARVRQRIRALER